LNILSDIAEKGEYVALKGGVETRAGSRVAAFLQTAHYGSPFPSELSLCIGGSRPSSNTWFRAPTWIYTLNNMSFGSTAFAGITIMTDRQLPRYSGL